MHIVINMKDENKELQRWINGLKFEIYTHKARTRTI